MRGKIFALLLAVATFAGGLYIGAQRNTTVIDDGSRGASYGGGSPAATFIPRPIETPMARIRYAEPLR